MLQSDCLPSFIYRTFSLHFVWYASYHAPVNRNILHHDLLSLALTVILISVIPACRTAVLSATDKCPVEIWTDGSVHVGGKTCRMEDIPDRLKSAGFSSDTMIRISVPENVKAETYSRVSSLLLSGGYPQSLFVKPLQKESFSKDADGKQGRTPSTPARE